MRSFLAALVLFLCSGTAFAVGEISAAAQQLALDVDARIVAIGTPAPKPLANEAKNLKLAKAKLAKYSGGERVPDLKVLATAGKFLALSRTEDPAITADVIAMLQAFLDGAKYRQGRFEQFKALLIDPKHLAALKATEAAALRTIDAAEAALDTSPVKAAALLVKAYDLFGLISDQAKRFGILEDGSPPPSDIVVGLTAVSANFVNLGASTYTIDRIRVFGSITDGVTLVQGFTGQSAAALIPGLFAAKGSNRVVASGTFELATVLARLVPVGTADPHFSGELHVYLKGEKFFVVSVADIALP